MTELAKLSKNIHIYSTEIYNSLNRLYTPGNKKNYNEALDYTDKLKNTAKQLLTLLEQEIERAK